MKRLLQIQHGIAELGRWIDTGLIVVCGVLLCLMAAVVFFEVMIRYALSSPTGWTEGPTSCACMTSRRRPISCWSGPR